MKKFCSSCGNQLELSKRACSECGAPNPFFIANFTLLEDQSNELEKLRIEKEKIEKELVEKEAAQVEFQRQEQLKKDLEELERQKKETQEKERRIRETLEQRTEQEFKKELLQVKRETELYKKETMDMLQEIREELKQKSDELKQKTEELSRQPKVITVEKQVPVQVQAPVQTAPAPERMEAPKAAFIYEAPKKGGVMNMAAALGLMLIVAVGMAWAYFYFNSDARKQLEGASQSTVEPGQTTTTPEVTPKTETPKTENSFSSSATDTTGVGQSTPQNPNLLAEASVTTKPKVTVDTTKPKVAFELTVSRAMNDLIGRKLSGCNIVIHSVSEIDHISHPVLIEKLPSGYLKYKLTVEIAQSNEIYNSTPYIYYTSDGRFLKIDGTSCE